MTIILGSTGFPSTVVSIISAIPTFLLFEYAHSPLLQGIARSFFHSSFTVETLLAYREISCLPPSSLFFNVIKLSEIKINHMMGLSTGFFRECLVV